MIMARNLAAEARMYFLSVAMADNASESDLLVGK